MSGMMKVPSLNGSLYFQGILDDASKYSFSTFHKTIDTVPADTIAELERYWAEMVKSANTLRNLSPYAGSDQTPYEMFNGTKPNVDHLRIIGCMAYVHIPVKSRNFKHISTRPTPRRSERATKKPDFLSCLAASDIPIPKNVKEALSSANAADWQQAMLLEVTSLSDMNSWSLADLPPGSKVIGTKWVFDIKRLVSGEIDRFKARLVAKGYAQRPGMDSDEVFAPVAKLATIRFILSMAADPTAHLAQLDVSTAFLNGIVEEEIYCTQPPQFEKDHRVCRMWKCLNGLKQASRQWYLKVKEDMIGLGFIEVDVDQGLFILPSKSNKPIIGVLLWVDDFLLLSFDEKILLQYKAAIMALYKT
eukprot:gene17571-biopygen26537